MYTSVLYLINYITDDKMTKYVVIIHLLLILRVWHYIFIVQYIPFLQLSSQLELWAEELQHVELSTDAGKAEQYLQIHNDSIVHMQNCVFEVLQRGQDLCGVSYCTLMYLSVYNCTWCNDRGKLGGGVAQFVLHLGDILFMCIRPLKFHRATYLKVNLKYQLRIKGKFVRTHISIHPCFFFHFNTEIVFIFQIFILFNFKRCRCLKRPMFKSWLIPSTMHRPVYRCC